MQVSSCPRHACLLSVSPGVRHSVGEAKIKGTDIGLFVLWPPFSSFLETVSSSRNRVWDWVGRWPSLSLRGLS